MKAEHLKIEKCVFGGYGIAFLEDCTYFIRNTLPGEIVSVSLSEVKKNISFGSASEIVEPAKNRIKPICSKYLECGGCSFLHTSYDDELHLKRSIIKDSLQRIAKIKSIPDIKIIYDDRYNYRSIASIHQEDQKSGFHAFKSNKLVVFPDEGCHLLRHELIDFIKSGHRAKSPYKLAVENSGTVIYDQHMMVNEQVGNLHYQHPLDSFFQSNSLLRESMLFEVIQLTKEISANTIFDAGCGCGFFTIAAAAYCSKITGFDIDKKAVSIAQNNANINGVSNAHFLKMDFDTITINKQCSIIADPPRSGLTKKFKDTILKGNVASIIYISCDPTTWSRDIADLQEKYKLAKVIFIDMFPGTYHIELISLLIRI